MLLATLISTTMVVVLQQFNTEIEALSYLESLNFQFITSKADRGKILVGGLSLEEIKLRARVLINCVTNYSLVYLFFSSFFNGI